MKLVLIVVVLAACGSNKEPADRSTKAGSAGSAAAPAAKPAADLFTGKVVTLPAPLANVRFGMSEAEAKAAAPDAFAKDGALAGYDHVTVHVAVSKKGVYSMYVDLPDSQDTAKGWLTQKWGPPLTKNDAVGKPEYFWNAPDAGLQAKLEAAASHSIVYFSRIMPFAQFLGSDPQRFGFEKLPLIGATPDAVKAAYTDYPEYSPFVPPDDPDELVLQFPPTEGTVEVGSQVALRIKKGKVTGYTLTFVPSEHTHAQLDQVAAKLEAIFGKRTRDDIYTNFGKLAKTELRPDRDDATVWVGDYKK